MRTAKSSKPRITLPMVRKELKKHANPKKAIFLRRFFKTGPGEYAEGDQLLGVMVPYTKKVAKAYQALDLKEVKQLLKSKFHEERLLALFMLVHKFEQGSPEFQQTIYNLYLKHTKFINNWDLVDASAHRIVGPFLQTKNKSPLTRLANSKQLWERRISMLSTFHYIKQDQFKETIRIARILLNDKEDLIHKAVGWMLREVGKRDLKTEETFLKKYYRKMPRTMLRYAIEKFPATRRKAYLQGTLH